MYRHFQIQNVIIVLNRITIRMSTLTSAHHFLLSSIMWLRPWFGPTARWRKPERPKTRAFDMVVHVHIYNHVESGGFLAAPALTRPEIPDVSPVLQLPTCEGPIFSLSLHVCSYRLTVNDQMGGLFVATRDELCDTECLLFNVCVFAIKRITKIAVASCGQRAGVSFGWSFTTFSVSVKKHSPIFVHFGAFT